MAPHRPRVTLVDVAEQACVSTSTASRVLHGGAEVSQELAGRVRDAATNLDYTVNQQARSLRRGWGDVIGVVVEDFTIPFFGRIVATAERMAREAGHGVIIACAGTGSTSEQPAVESLLSRNVAGLLVGNGAGPEPSGYLRDLAGALPVVVIDAAYPDAHADSVTVDNAEGARRATAHLIRHGHREIVFVGSATSAKTVVLRYEGYRRALTDAGIEPRDELAVWAGHGTADVQPAVAKALLGTPGATALFSSGARTTPGSLSAMGAVGRRDMAFTAFDDLESAEAFSPPLTVVGQDADLIGAHAMSLLFDRIAGHEGPPRHVRVELTFHERGSGEAAPAGFPPPVLRRAAAQRTTALTA